MTIVQEYEYEYTVAVLIPTRHPRYKLGTPQVPPRYCIGST